MEREVKIKLKGDENSIRVDKHARELKEFFQGGLYFLAPLERQYRKFEIER